MDQLTLLGRVGGNLADHGSGLADALIYVRAILGKLMQAWRLVGLTVGGPVVVLAGEVHLCGQ